MTIPAEDLSILREKGVTADVAQKIFLAQREHPRRQKYTCHEIDSSKSVISSIVAGLFMTGGTPSNRLGEGYLFFGQVLHFLLCQTGTGHQQFAKIQWKEAPVEDCNVPGLWRVGGRGTIHKTTVVSISDLSPPFTTAVDSDENLWILDFNRKYVSNNYFE